MDPTDILEVIVALIGFPGLALVGLLLLALWWRRRRPPADPAEAEERRTPAGVWLLIGVLAVGFVGVDSTAATRWPAARGWLLAAYIAPAVAALVVAAFWPRRDGLLLSRRIRRGDVAGAIAALEAKVARDPDPDAAPAPPPASADDPWAAPKSAFRSPAARLTLAHRLNLLGLLEFKREDWGRALHWFERAERAGGGGLRDLPANRGAALVRLGRVAEGLALVRAAFDALPPGRHRAVRAKVMLQLAGALVAAGQLDEARARIDEAEAEVDRFSPILARVRPTYRAATQTLRDRLAAAEAGAAPTPPASSAPHHPAG